MSDEVIAKSLAAILYAGGFSVIWWKDGLWVAGGVLGLILGNTLTQVIYGQLNRVAIGDDRGERS